MHEGRQTEEAEGDVHMGEASQETGREGQTHRQRRMGVREIQRKRGGQTLRKKTEKQVEGDAESGRVTGKKTGRVLGSREKEVEEASGRWPTHL